MILYVYDYNLLRIGVVEDITSLQWLAIYNDAGEAKLVCAATDENLRLLVDGNRLYTPDQPESAIIRQIEVDDDAQSGTMTVRALFSVARWGDRIVMATEHITDIETGMLSIAEKNRRGLPGTTAVAKGLLPTTDTQITWGSVLDAEITLAAVSGLGFRETFDPVNASEIFECYAGENRTQGDAYNGYFGNDVDNVSKLKLQRGTADWANVAIVGGQGEGIERKIVIVQLGDYEGDDRREIWVDAKDIGKTYQIAAEDSDGNYTYTEATYSDAEYEAILASRGLEALRDQLPEFVVSAELGQGPMTFGQDYFLGDIVPIKFVRYGLLLSARVSKVRTTYEQNGRTISAVLSDYTITQEAFT